MAVLTTLDFPVQADCPSRLAIVRFSAVFGQDNSLHML